MKDFFGEDYKNNEAYKKEYFKLKAAELAVIARNSKVEKKRKSSAAVSRKSGAKRIS